MFLPKLTVAPLEAPITSGVGAHTAPCSTCPMRSVCRECNGARTDCRQKSCLRECNTCGGSELDIELRRAGNVPAVCVKSPLRDLCLDLVKKDTYDFKQRKKIDLEKKSIVVTQGSAGRSAYKLYPDDASAIAVNLRHVWSSHGWYSQDMRDYLRVESKNTKLILLTTTLDDVLERAWEKQVYESDFRSVGFDYWQALNFSHYYDMSHCFNLWSSYRTLYAIEASRAHFSFVVPDAVNRRHPDILTSPWAEVVRAVPNVHCHVQWIKVNTPSGVAMFTTWASRVRRWLRQLDVDVTLWFMGVTTYPLAYNIAKVFGEYDCYFMSVNPWLTAHKGAEFTSEGKTKRSKLPKSDLILLNQQAYAKLISQALQDARTGRTSHK